MPQLRLLSLLCVTIKEWSGVYEVFNSRNCSLFAGNMRPFIAVKAACICVIIYLPQQSDTFLYYMRK